MYVRGMIKMAKTAVIYATKTKHSKKLAEAIGSALDVKAQSILDNPILTDVELLFIVGGIYGGESLPALIEYLKGLDVSTLKRAALVTSCASGKQKQAAAREVLEQKGIAVVDEFVCKGALLFVAATHPNSKDINSAKDFALKIASQE